MSAGIKQHTAVVTTTDASSYTRSLSSVVAGNYLILAHTGITSGATVSSITSTGTPTWTKIVSKTNPHSTEGKLDTELWICKNNTSTAPTVTVHLTATDDAQGTLYECNATTGTVIVSGSAGGTTTKAETQSGPSLTPTATGQLAIYAWAAETVTFTHGPSGWTSVLSPDYPGYGAFGLTAIEVTPSTAALAPIAKCKGGTSYWCGIGVILGARAPIPLAGSASSTSSISGALTVVTHTDDLGGQSTSTSSASGTLTVGTPVTYTHISGFPTTNELANNTPQETITQSMTTGAVGDLVIALVHNGVYGSSTGNYTRIAYATAVTDSAGAITWHPGAVERGQDKTYPATPSGMSYEIWFGTVVKASTATTITASFASPGVTDLFLYLDQWSSSLGSGTNWSFVVGGFTAFDGNSTTVDFPNLTSSSHGGLYWGYSYGSITDTEDMTPGSTPGFTYYVTTKFGNMIAYNGALAPTTAYEPTCTQAYSGHGWYDSIAAIFVAGSVPVALAGSVASSSSATAAISVPVTLVGHASSPSSLAGTLGVGIALASSTASASTLEGTLDESGSLSGTIASTSILTGSSRFPVALEGSASSASSANATLTVNAPAALTGASSSASHLSATLSVPITLAGSTVSTSVAAGALSTPVILAGTVTSSSSMIGTLGIPVSMTGASVSSSLLTGTLVVPLSTALSGLVESMSTLSGSLEVVPAAPSIVLLGPARTWIALAPARTWRVEASSP